MKKAYVLYGDYWHKLDAAEAFVEGLFEEEVVFTSNAEDIPWEDLESQVSVFIAMKADDKKPNNDIYVDNWLTEEREEALYRYVNAGNGVIFVHAGLVGIRQDSQYHKVAGGTFLTHPEQTDVTYVPVNKSHPILAGVEAFTARDEKYTCQVDPDVEVLLVGTDPTFAGCISGWCKTSGKGRTVCFTPGHYAVIAQDPNVKQFMRNAVNWVREERL